MFHVAIRTTPCRQFQTSKMLQLQTTNHNPHIISLSSTLDQWHHWGITWHVKRSSPIWVIRTQVDIVVCFCVSPILGGQENFHHFEAYWAYWGYVSPYSRDLLESSSATRALSIPVKCQPEVWHPNSRCIFSCWTHAQWEHVKGFELTTTCSAFSFWGHHLDQKTIW